MKRMKIDTRLNRILSAGAMLLLSQSALGEGVATKVQRELVSGRAPEVVRVTARRQKSEFSMPAIEIDTTETIERLQRQLDKDFARDLENMSKSRIEFVISEVPTRG